MRELLERIGIKINGLQLIIILRNVITLMCGI